MRTKKLAAGAAVVVTLGLSAALAATLTSAAPSTSTASPAGTIIGNRGTVAAAATPAVIAMAQPATAAALAVRHQVLGGVNISGGEFGTVPGRLGYQYAYPTTAEIDWFHARGAKIVRVPFRWERLQPALYGPLAAADRAALKAVTSYATAKGMVVVLDMHDYARRRPTLAAPAKALVGAADLTASALSNAWTRIGEDYRDDPNVWFGLMNEPYGIAAADWWRSAQQVVDDLRGQRFTNKLLVPGVSWTGAHSWIKSGNAAQAERFTDPGQNFAFEVHQYLDKDSSGTNAACTPGSARRVDAVIAWAELRKVKLFFGEIAGSAEAGCQTEYPAMLRKLNASGAVVGWTAWGAGRWWNASYPYLLGPVNKTEPSAHMLLVQANWPG